MLEQPQLYKARTSKELSEKKHASFDFVKISIYIIQTLIAIFVAVFVFGRKYEGLISDAKKRDIRVDAIEEVLYNHTGNDKIHLSLDTKDKEYISKDFYDKQYESLSKMFEKLSVRVSNIEARELEAASRKKEG